MKVYLTNYDKQMFDEGKDVWTLRVHIPYNDNHFKEYVISEDNVVEENGNAILIRKMD